MDYARRTRRKSRGERYSLTRKELKDLIAEATRTARRVPRGSTQRESDPILDTTRIPPVSVPNFRKILVPLEKGGNLEMDLEVFRRTPIDSRDRISKTS